MKATSAFEGIGGTALKAAAMVTMSFISAGASENVYLLEVPDYAWHAGCFGTAAGNLTGFWDRRGLPNMYTGPTAEGVAPLNSAGANGSIRALWASQEGVDGRPVGTPGHMDDYWESASSFESTAPDPYVSEGRQEHSPDCLGDFMGQSQRKYSNLNNECSGNIDGFAFNYWDKSGSRRTNFVPPEGIRDVQRGLKAWTQFRGYDAVVSSQLVDVNPEAPLGTGFSFADLKAEIKAGFPVLIILQDHGVYSRTLNDLANANPVGHAILVHGYVEDAEGGIEAIRFKTSWGQGDEFALWSADDIVASLPMRGAITYHPQPKITNMQRDGNQIRIEWEGPNAILQDELSGVATQVHRYVVERAPELRQDAFSAVTEPSASLEASVPIAPGATAQFFRVQLVAD